MNTTNSILLELNEISTIKIIKALKLIEENGINYTVIDNKSLIPEMNHKLLLYNNNLTSNKLIGNKDLKVLDLLANGKSYAQIATDIGVTVDGVRYYIKKIFKTLGVKNGRDAIRIYLTEMKSI